MRNIFPQLNFLKKYGWYLAGGTGLALQISHRTSIDFDFYNKKQFKSEAVLKIFEEKFSQQIEIILKEKNTLIINIQGIRLSYFFYPYSLIRPLINIESVAVASMEDIAAMKIIAIAQRGTKRDFIDLYYLLQKFNLVEIFNFVRKKYPKYNIYHALRALTFFKDAEKEDKTRNGKIQIFDSKFSWFEVKNYLLKAVKEYQLSLIKK